MSPWLVFPNPSPNATVRLFCFPYAGGGTAVYNAWARQLPSSIELCSVRLPGRESRLGERPFVTLDGLLPPLLKALRPYLDQPFAFFGHSMGALLSFELTRRLRQLGAPLPSMLFMSGFRAPHLPAARAPLHHLSEADFIAGLRRLGGTPSTVFDHPELLELVLPALRADFELVETYRHVAQPPLHIPITALGSQNDAIVSVPQLAAWQEHTTAVFSSHIFPGDHFYIHTETVSLLNVLVEALTKPASA